NEVEIVNNNGELKIRMSLKKLLKGEDINAKVYFRELKSVEASEGAIIEGPETMLTQTALEIISKEGSEVRLNLAVKRASIRSVTGGVVKLTGTGDNMDAKLGTGGILYAKDFATVQTQVSVTAGGNAEVNASELVDADVKAGGNVIIFGSPKQIDRSTSLGGTIEERK
ncbi:MAG TPA: head GIN domain-containing protein, partial [Flavobacterium sp.]